MTTLTLTSLRDLQTAVREHTRLLPRAGGSKPALSTPPDDATTVLDISAFTGVLAYDPGEFTFTARAATPIREVNAMLAQHGQYLPFDPLLPDRATLGGVLAANTAGSMRLRFGGLRDFILMIRFVDGTGEHIRGGANVVKNSAGFDLPKLFVGSLGRLGILTELTFKVFPAPQATHTLRAEYDSLDDALSALYALTHAPFDLEALDLRPAADSVALLARLGGLPAALPARLAELRAFLTHGDIIRDDAALWSPLIHDTWRAPDSALVKVPLTPARIPLIEHALAGIAAARWYSVAGNVLWLALDPAHLPALDSRLTQLNLSGLLLSGATYPHALLGKQPDPAFTAHVATALDPHGRFLPLTPILA